MSPTQRLEAAAQMSDDVRALAAAGIRARQPGLSEAEVQAALVRLLVGGELEIESAERDPDAR
jgi:predicted Zn-dependent peptidase